MGGINKAIGKLVTGDVGGAVGDVLGINPRRATAPLRNFQPTSFSTAGLNADVTGQNVNLTRTPLLNQTLSQLGSAFNTQISELGSIREQLTPGFGALTNAAVSALENRRRAAIGNLRENLQRRRVLGSSFASDALSRAEAEFGQQEAEIRATNQLRELEANIGLINQQAQARQQQFSTILQQLNFDSELAARLSSGTSSIMAQNAQLQADLISGAQTAGASAALDLAGIGAGFLSGKGA